MCGKYTSFYLVVKGGDGEKLEGRGFFFIASGKVQLFIAL